MSDAMTIFVQAQLPILVKWQLIHSTFHFHNIPHYCFSEILRHVFACKVRRGQDLHEFVTFLVYIDEYYWHFSSTHKSINYLNLALALFLLQLCFTNQCIFGASQKSCKQ